MLIGLGVVCLILGVQMLIITRQPFGPLMCMELCQDKNCSECTFSPKHFKCEVRSGTPMKKANRCSKFINIAKNEINERGRSSLQSRCCVDDKLSEMSSGDVATIPEKEMPGILVVRLDNVAESQQIYKMKLDGNTVSNHSSISVTSIQSMAYVEFKHALIIAAIYRNDPSLLMCPLHNCVRFTSISGALGYGKVVVDQRKKLAFVKVSGKRLIVRKFDIESPTQLYDVLKHDQDEPASTNIAIDPKKKRLYLIMHNIGIRCITYEGRTVGTRRIKYSNDLRPPIVFVSLEDAIYYMNNDRLVKVKHASSVLKQPPIELGELGHAPDRTGDMLYNAGIIYLSCVLNDTGYVIVVNLTTKALLNMVRMPVPSTLCLIP